MLLLIAACGGAGDPTPTPDPSETARAAQVTLNELPRDWRETPQGDAVEANVQLTPDCDIFNPGIVFPGSLASDHSSSFQGPDKQQAQSFAAVYGTTNDAQKAIDGLHDIADRCGDKFKDTLKRLAEDQLSALGVDLGVFAGVDVGMDRLDDPPLGDASTGYRVRVEVSVAGSTQGKFTIDYRMFRRDKLTAAVLYAAFNDLNSGEEQSIDQAVLEKAGASHT